MLAWRDGGKLPYKRGSEGVSTFMCCTVATVSTYSCVYAYVCVCTVFQEQYAKCLHKDGNTHNICPHKSY